MDFPAVPLGRGGSCVLFCSLGLSPFPHISPYSLSPLQNKDRFHWTGSVRGKFRPLAATGMVIGALRVSLGLARAQQTLEQASKCSLLLLLRRCEAQVVAVELKGLEK